MSDIKTSKQSEAVRREITMMSLAVDQSSIVIKLWNDKARCGSCPTEGQKVLFVNMETNFYKGYTTLNSTDETAIEV